MSNIITKRVLLSVYSKSPTFNELVQRLHALDYALIASGGTYKHISEVLNLPVVDVAEISGHPPVLRHRVATLVPEVHGGLLADPDIDMEELDGLGWPFIDMVVCTFYPLKETIKADPFDIAGIIEKIDIGGPTLVRSACKGGRIVVVAEDEFLPTVELLEKGQFTKRQEFRLQADAIRHVAEYVAAEAKFRHDRFVNYDAV